MTRKPLSLLFLAATIAASANAHAQTPACGTTLTGPVVFNADMVCPAGLDGLVIGAPNVRIDLNGYAITSPNSTATRGVRSSGFSGIKIVGPGKITGFDTSVMITGGGFHEIRDVDAANVSTAGARIGIWLHNASRSVVERSRMGVLELGSDSGGSARANRIAGNDADSIHLYGCQTNGNEIADNDVHPATQFMAISLYGVTTTEIVANRVAGTVWLGGSSENRVFNNTIDNTHSPSWIHTGVAIIEDLPPCGGAVMIPSTANVVQSNAIIGAQVGVLMARGSLKNRIMWNKIYGQRAIGTQFFPGSDDNDARGNGYGAPVEVVDLGRGNLWP